MLISLLPSFVPGLLGASQAAAKFDFEHVEKALIYFDAHDEKALLDIAESRATAHLLKHSERTGYFPPETTGLELTRTLLNNPPPRVERLDAVKELVSYIRANPERQAACLEEAEEYLPTSFELAAPLFLTWGYDIGVAMDGTASLNLAHDHFVEDREEVWFFCIHEMHHAGVMQRHPMVRLSEIATTGQLFELVKYSTFLEGTATFAAYAARERAGALSKDRDYVALADEERMRGYRDRYFQVYERMGSRPNRKLVDSDWNVLEDLSDGDRLWYRVGAAMAATIDAKLGRARFREIVSEGPNAFFRAYFALED